MNDLPPGELQELKREFERLELARASGQLECVPDLAWCHYWGLGTPRDPSKSAAVLKEAIDPIKPWFVPKIPLAAQYALGIGVPRDESMCMQLLGECGDWHFSRRLLEDAELRYVWLAAWQGDAQSQYRMAELGLKLGTLTWEFGEYARWLRIAALGGVAAAQYEIAKGYERSGDRDAASHWKWRAALQKHGAALEDLRESGDGVMGAFERGD